MLLQFVEVYYEYFILEANYIVNIMFRFIYFYNSIFCKGVIL